MQVREPLSQVSIAMTYLSSSCSKADTKKCTAWAFSSTRKESLPKKCMTPPTTCSMCCHADGGCGGGALGSVGSYGPAHMHWTCQIIGYTCWHDDSHCTVEVYTVREQWMALYSTLLPLSHRLSDASLSTCCCCLNRPEVYSQVREMDASVKVLDHYNG